MAIGVDSIVAINLALTPSPVGPGIVVRGPLFGRVLAAAGSPPVVDVLWENGTLTSGVPASALSEISAASSAATPLVFRVVTPAAGGVTASPEFQGVVIAAFTRDAGPDRVVVQSLSSEGLVYETLAAAVKVVQGR